MSWRVHVRWGPWNCPVLAAFAAGFEWGPAPCCLAGQTKRVQFDVTLN